MESPRLQVSQHLASLRFDDSLPSICLRPEVVLVGFIPGVRVSPHTLHFPRSTWQLPEVRQLLESSRNYDHARVTLAPPSSTRTSLWNGCSSLYPHQVEAAGRALQSGGLLLADEMGLGKTRTAIVAAETAASEVGGDRARLVLAPRFARAVWRDELLRMGAISSPEEFCAIEGLSLDSASWRPDAKWYFVHYEIAGAWWSRFNSMGRRRPVAVIIDEIHWAKNPRTRRAKAAAAISCVTGGLVMGLTGTPLANKPSELWQPLTLITGPRSWGRFNDFRIRYCGAHLGGGTHLEDGDPTNVPELEARLETCYLRRTAQSINLQLPPLVRQKIEVDIDQGTLELHRDLLSHLDVRELVRSIVQRRAGRESLSILHKLRKLTSAAKLRSTVEYVSELREQGRTCVVFAWERNTVEQLAKRFGTYYFVHGGCDQETREQAIAYFQTQGATLPLVATFDSLKEGVTLTRADVVVMHDLDWVPSTVLQAEKRVHRIGQQAPVTSAWMIAQNSIDTIIADVLLLKAEQIQTMLGIDAPQQLMDELDLGSVAYDALADFDARLARWRAAG